MSVCILWICDFNCEPFSIRTAHAITGRDTPQALPKAVKNSIFYSDIPYEKKCEVVYIPCFDLTNTYGTFLSSHNSGKCKRISKGSASAAITINSASPLFSAFVAAKNKIFTLKGYFTTARTSKIVIIIISKD